MSAAAKFCHCGRKLGHTGRHIGFTPSPKSDAPSPKATKPLSKDRFVSTIEGEIKACHTRIAYLKTTIKDNQHALIDAELKLKPLIALLEVYGKTLQIAGPTTQTAASMPELRVDNTSPTSFPPFTPPAEEEEGESDEEDDGPVEATFEQVRKWAVVRNLRFQTWADLGSINSRRAQFRLPPFKKAE